MKLKLIDSSTVSLARMVGLVKQVRPVELKCETARWALLVEGRWFTRLLREDVLPPSPNLIRPMGWNTPRPELFHSAADARRYVERMGWVRARRFEIVESKE